MQTDVKGKCIPGRGRGVATTLGQEWGGGGGSSKEPGEQGGAWLQMSPETASEEGRPQQRRGLCGGFGFGFDSG